MPRPNRESSSPKKGNGNASRYSAVGRRESEDRGKFSETVASMLGVAIDRVIDDGDAILISRTSDGGAISVQLLADDGRHATYPVTQAELDGVLEQLANP